MSGHTSRVLHLSQSPDGTTVCSAAADETLRFWKCFAEAPPAQKVCSRLQSTRCSMPSCIPLDHRDQMTCYTGKHLTYMAGVQRQACLGLLARS